MKTIEEINEIFSEYNENFTVYVVEQRFFVESGREYFKQFINKENFINDDNKITKRIEKILHWIHKKIPNISEIIKKIILSSNGISVISIVDVIVELNNLFTRTEHQAAGVDVIDPIIIEEKNINPKYLTQLVTLHRESILKPVIIIILKDNDFERAKVLLANCPHDMNAKFIRNNGKHEIYKVINTGANNIEDFIDAFSRQCFSTCSKTEKNIILGSEWNQQDIIHAISPSLLKTRTHLLYDEKQDALEFINNALNKITLERQSYSSNEDILNSFEFMAKLYRVYCNDYGGRDILDAIALAEKSEIDLLKAHLYRYSQFIPNISRDEQKKLLNKAKEIFKSHNVMDHAIYCDNNYLLHSFYSDNVNRRLFTELQEQAIQDVPGMVGMSIILNNVGVAYLYEAQVSEAITYFKKGLDYSKERIVQRIGLESNILIAKACNYERVSIEDILRVLDLTAANFNSNKLPFIGANYMMNMLVIALEQHRDFVPEIMNKYPIYQMLSSALTNNIMGTGTLTQQIVVINSKYPQLNLSKLPVCKNISQISGVRAKFIIQKGGYNPIIFNAWL